MVFMDSDREFGDRIMAHFAKIEDNTVREVVVVSNADCGNLDFPESEPVGQQYLAACGLTGDWLQTSYNATFRGAFAGIGFMYDEESDTFVAPPPPPSAE